MKRSFSVVKRTFEWTCTDYINNEIFEYLTHGKAVPVTVEQPASNRGPLRKQHDLFTFIVMSNICSTLLSMQTVVSQSALKWPLIAVWSCWRWMGKVLRNNSAKYDAYKCRGVRFLWLISKPFQLRCAYCLIVLKCQLIVWQYLLFMLITAIVILPRNYCNCCAARSFELLWVLLLYNLSVAWRLLLKFK
jgi:hypothetical protein